MSQPRNHSQVLNLDDPLNRLALLEAVQLLDRLRALLEPHGRSDCLEICWQTCLRLCYVCLQAPAMPEVDRASLLALHHHSQTQLALRLGSLRDSLQELEH